MKRFFTARTILILILALAAILRFFSLGNVPSSASMDEASIGFNAYSILKTGGDEYGELPILSHRAYDDWRRATYLYLVIPFVALIDLNVIAVRLPAVILSVLTVWATYFLVKELFTINSKSEARNTKQIQNSNNQNLTSYLPLLTSFFLAISPWHIYISRLGHESNAGLAFLVFGVLFFLQGQKDKLKLLLSMIFFTLSMVSYYSGQVFIPPFVMGLFFIFRKNLLSMVSSDKKILVGFFIFLILLVPIFKLIFSPEAVFRFQGTSIFRPEVHWERFNQRMELWGNAVENNDIVGTILYSRHLFPFQVFIEGYIAHFKPEWLFMNFSDEPHKVPNMGLLYLWEIPLIAVGIVALLFSRIFNMKAKLLIFLWFFLGPLPAAIATQTPHAMRSYNFLPTWQILTAIGTIFALQKISNIKYQISNIQIKYLIFAMYFSFLIFNFLFFLKNYFIVFPREQSRSFQYALSKAIPYVRQLADEKKYDKVVFANKDNLYQSYMFFLYYSGYDPVLYQRQGGTKSGGFRELHSFGKFEFRPIEWEREERSGKVLLVGNPSDFPQKANIIKTFLYLNGKEGVKIGTR